MCTRSLHRKCEAKMGVVQGLTLGPLVGARSKVLLEVQGVKSWKLIAMVLVFQKLQENCFVWMSLSVMAPGTLVHVCVH